jgi:hypothetical protein
MGFVNFYCCFIQDFFTLAKALTDTTLDRFPGKNWG